MDKSTICTRNQGNKAGFDLCTLLPAGQPIGKGKQTWKQESLHFQKNLIFFSLFLLNSFKVIFIENVPIQTIITKKAVNTISVSSF